MGAINPDADALLPVIWLAMVIGLPLFVGARARQKGRSFLKWAGAQVFFIVLALEAASDMGNAAVLVVVLPLLRLAFVPKRGSELVPEPRPEATEADSGAAR